MAPAPLDPPAISVLMPVRDARPYLDEAIDSLTAQTESRFEVIAVDDGSTDGSRERLAEWARGDRRVRLIEQPRRGIVAALERARGVARGRFLARMDADDIALPDRLRRQVELLEGDASISAVGCGVRYFPERDVRDGARRYEAWINSITTPEEIDRDIFVECPIAHPTLVIRASRLEAIGGYVDHGWPEDYDVVLRLWAAGHRMAKVDARLLLWRERPDRLSRSDARYGADAFRRCKIHYLKRTILRREREIVIWGAGPTGKAFARALIAEGMRPAAFVDLDARKIGHRIHGARVVHPDAVGGPAGRCLAAVGQRGARDEIRFELSRRGWHEGRDYVAVA